MLYKWQSLLLVMSNVRQAWIAQVCVSYHEGSEWLLPSPPKALKVYPL